VEPVQNFLAPGCRWAAWSATSRTHAHAHRTILSAGIYCANAMCQC